MSVIEKKRVELGLGSESSVSLKTARILAAQLREAVALGRDPRDALKVEGVEPEKGAPLFGDFTDAILVDILPGLKNEKHRSAWQNTLATHAASLRPMRVDAITTEDILGVLRPIWQRIPEQASRVRQRLERVLGAAKAAGHRPLTSPNPAAWKDNLAHFLPSPKAATHHAAIPWDDMPAFWAKLMARNASTSAQCLRFLILTAARTGEALGAMPCEFDDLEPRYGIKDGERVRIDSPRWTVPADRMKMKREHSVPLSDSAAAIVRDMIVGLEPSDRIFKLSGMACAMLLRDMKRTETVHGMRSSFRDWAGEATDYPRELAEMALAHAVGSAVEQSYRRGRAFERRRPLMRDWAAYLASAPKIAIEPDVTPVASSPIEPIAKARRAPVRSTKAKRASTGHHPGQVVLFED